MSIGARLKAWRAKKNLNQKEASSISGVSFSTYQNYEMDISPPGAKSLQGFINAGLSADWLLTGEGPMLFADRLGAAGHIAPKSEAPMPSSPVNYDLLRSLIESLETALDERDLELTPARKAAVVQLMYEYCMLEDEPAKPDVTVERFLKLVA